MFPGGAANRIAERRPPRALTAHGVTPAWTLTLPGKMRSRNTNAEGSRKIAHNDIYAILWRARGPERDESSQGRGSAEVPTLRHCALPNKWGRSGWKSATSRMHTTLSDTRPGEETGGSRRWQISASKLCPWTIVRVYYCFYMVQRYFPVCNYLPICYIAPHFLSPSQQPQRRSGVT